MNEIGMNKRLKKLVIFTVCMLFVLLIAGIFVTDTFFESFVNNTTDKMYEEAENYEGRIESQIDRNFQLMNSVASTIKSCDIKNIEHFKNVLSEVDKSNDYLMIGYMGIDGYGVFSSNYGDDVKEVTIDQLQPEAYDAVAKSFNGEEVVTDTFMGEVSSQRVFLFTVPVFSGDEVIGSLFGSDSVDAFSNVFEENNPLYGRGFVHLVDADGKFVIKSNHMVVKEDVSTLFGEPYMSGEEVQRCKEAAKTRESIEFEFKYNGEEYTGLLEAMDINGWYVCCINTIGNVNKNVYSIAYVVAIFFVIVLCLFLFSFYMGYRVMKKVNAALRKMAYYDDLTGLYNIKHFMELTDEAIAISDSYAMVSLNIRKFKFINEIYGKKQADRLLIYISKVLENLIRYDEFACRESADYFYLFLKCNDERILRNRIQKAINEITSVNESRIGKYQLRLSCGIATNDDSTDTQSLMTKSLFALAKAKNTNINEINFFDHNLHEQEQLNNYIETNAKTSLENNEFKLYLQPKFDLKTNELCGAEALVRWIKNDGSILYPNIFIPLFERNGFCSQLDMYMFEMICKQLRYWIDNGYSVVPISINQSRTTFYEEGYEEHLLSCLNRYQIDASLITLEILEGLIIDDFDRLNYKLNYLKQMGFKISMDDFGTGYSSLNALGRLNIDEVKFDRGFLLEAKKSDDINIVLEEIVRLAKRLEISTVIEGIETKEVEKFVRDIGVDIGQGYLYSKPIEARNFTNNFIKNR